MYERLEGKNIVLRKAKISDWKSMLQHVWSDENIYQWMLFRPALTEEEAIERCKRSMEFQKNHYAYFVAIKKTDEAIGFCTINEYEENRYEESGICIGTNFQGKGYGKEVLELLLDLAFNKLSSKDFRYGYFFNNIKSKKLSQHYGFVYSQTQTINRPWDNSIKRVEYCLLTKEIYNKNIKSKNSNNI